MFALLNKADMMAGRRREVPRVGRPPKDAAERRRNRVVVMLTDAELERLEEIAQGAPLGTALYGMVGQRLKSRRK
jgi:hypothetical protein